MDMIEDEDTWVLGGYVEGIKDGLKMMEVAERAIEKRKPIVLLKGGISERGAQAARLHTGSIAGSADVALATFEQKGVITVDGIEELFDIATILADVQKQAKDELARAMTRPRTIVRNRACLIAVSPPVSQSEIRRIASARRIPLRGGQAKRRIV